MLTSSVSGKITGCRVINSGVMCKWCQFTTTQERGAGAAPFNQCECERRHVGNMPQNTRIRSGSGASKRHEWKGCHLQRERKWYHV